VAVACLTGVVYAVWETTKNFQPGISVFARHLMWALSALAPAPLFYLGLSPVLGPQRDVGVPCESCSHLKSLRHSLTTA